MGTGNPIDKETGKHDTWRREESCKNRKPRYRSNTLITTTLSWKGTRDVVSLNNVVRTNVINWRGQADGLYYLVEFNQEWRKAKDHYNLLWVQFFWFLGWTLPSARLYFWLVSVFIQEGLISRSVAIKRSRGCGACG